MSVSKWAYSPEKCDFEICVGDCDHCGKANEDEVEADGFITRSALQYKSRSTAAPAEECAYPKCEECDRYHGHYCTVPMVVSKQNWLMLGEKLTELTHRLSELEKLVIDEILGDKGKS